MQQVTNPLNLLSQHNVSTDKTTAALRQNI